MGSVKIMETMQVRIGLCSEMPMEGSWCAGWDLPGTWAGDASPSCSSELQMLVDVEGGDELRAGESGAGNVHPRSKATTWEASLHLQGSWCRERRGWRGGAISYSTLMPLLPFSVVNWHSGVIM